MSEQDWCPTPQSPVPAGEPGSPELPPVQQLFNRSTLCSRGWQPTLITGFLRNFLTDQWSNAINIYNPDLKQFVWSNNPTSGILIETAYRFNPGSAGQRPAIVLKRNRIKFMQLGLGSRQQGVVKRPLETGAITEYQNKVIGSHTVFCLNWSGAGVEALSTEVRMQLLEFSDPIRQHLSLHQFTVLEEGAVHQLQDSANSYIVPITVGWAYEATWALKLQSLPLKTFQITHELE
jgi:hypothetical protein